MKNRTIYENALRLLAQRVSSSYNEDLEERAPYLIASFCNEAMDIDAHIRKALGLEEIADFDKVWLSFDDDFPLLDRFASVAAQYLASMLVIDEDGELSDKLYELYCDGISLIKDEIPSALESIVDRYF